MSKGWIEVISQNLQQMIDRKIVYLDYSYYISQREKYNFISKNEIKDNIPDE